MSLERYQRIAVFGGVYSNHIALEAAVADAGRRDVDAIFCLGDLGGFGPHPDKVFPILINAGVQVMQGNYDHSIGEGLADCRCGYTDPRDNLFAKISYEYTSPTRPTAGRDGCGSFRTPSASSSAVIRF